MTAGKMLAEGIGTFALVFVGILAIVNGVGLLEWPLPTAWRLRSWRQVWAPSVVSNSEPVRKI